MLFDNVPHRLRTYLSCHEVITADEMAWAHLENGQLLAATETAGFFLIVTADKNLSYQQNLRRRDLAIIVLSTDNWNLIKIDPSAIAAAVEGAKRGSFESALVRGWTTL